MSAVLTECPTIPGLLCDEPQPQRTAQQSVIDTLRVINAEQRVQLGVAQDEASRLRALLHESQRPVSAQDARIRQMQHHIDTLTGKVAPPMPHGWVGFVFPVKVDEATMYCLAQADNTVAAMWISGEWVTTEEFNGPLAFDTLDAAAEKWIKAQKQADDDSRAEDRARYLEGV